MNLSIRSAIGDLKDLAGRTTVGAVDLLVSRMLEAGIVERIVSEVLSRPETERLVARTLERPELERLIVVAVESPGTDRIVRRVLESPGTDRVITNVIESDEMQRVVEHIANSPEVQSAIQRQSLGLADSVAGELRSKSATADDRVERFARKVFRRRQRETLEVEAVEVVDVSRDE